MISIKPFLLILFIVIGCQRQQIALIPGEAVTPSPNPNPTPNPTIDIQLSLGQKHTCFVHQSQAGCFGEGESGKLGNGQLIDQASTVFIDQSGVLNGLTIKKIAAGSRHTCLIASDNHGYCFGRGQSGELGNGTNLDSSVPVAVDRSGVLSGLTLKSISVSSSTSGALSHSCAIASDDRLYCWGAGLSGQLGNGANVNSNTPVQVNLPGLTVKKVDLGSEFSCLVASNDRAYCFGFGGQGQLGLGDFASRNIPTAVVTSGPLSGVSVSAISTGHQHTCVLGFNNRAYCFGNGVNGELGLGITTVENTPMQLPLTGVLTNKTILSLSAGRNFTCLIASDHRAYCTGSDALESLGNPAQSNSLSPIAVDTSVDLSGVDLNVIESGGGHVCAQSTGDTFYCWGDNSHGELGVGTTITSPTPVKVN